MGTWQTFDVSPAADLTAQKGVLQELYQAGSRLIDSSPMYGQSEETVGAVTAASGNGNDFFYATKVWTTGRQEGIRQMEASIRLLQRPVMDLMQIHNLLDWQTHLETLRAWKAEGKIRYIGITHYTNDQHKELERIISSVPVDFVQFNYAIFSRHAEQRLLPAAAQHGVATLINRPLGSGEALKRVWKKPLPGWAKDYAIESWSQYFLKFIVSHPAVTCVIPATTSPAHMADNAKAGFGPFPDAAGRERMAAYVRSF